MKLRWRISVGFAAVALAAAPALAQLVDRTLAPNVANEGIAKSYEDQLGAGRGSLTTPGSSLFIINRDPARYRLDVDGTSGTMREHGPDGPDAVVDPLLEVHERAGAPEHGADVLPAHHVPGAAGQEHQQLEGLWRQTNPNAGPSELPDARVEVEGSEAHGAREGGTRCHLHRDQLKARS